MFRDRSVISFARLHALLKAVCLSRSKTTQHYILSRCVDGIDSFLPTDSMIGHRHNSNLLPFTLPNRAYLWHSWINQIFISDQENRELRPYSESARGKAIMYSIFCLLGEYAFFIYYLESYAVVLGLW